MKSKEVLKLLSISRVTFWSYVKNGTIKAMLETLKMNHYLNYHIYKNKYNSIYIY